MLIDKGFSQGDIVSLKVVNGDEIIAGFEEETDKDYKLSKPLAITVSVQGLAMIPWLFLGESELVRIKKEHVLAIVKSKDDAPKQYLQLTTGIALK